jgi:hypothetical protein
MQRCRYTICLPPVCGDFDILTKVVHHLIRNAIECCGKSFPRVHISSKRVDLDWVFSVEDNSPGIDPVFEGRGSSRFSSACAEKNTLGTGWDSHSCKKAIGWHGGRMWMESTSGAGSTFYFTLPPCRLKRNTSPTLRRDQVPRDSCLNGGQELHPCAAAGSSRMCSQATQFGSKFATPSHAGSKQVTGS